MILLRMAGRLPWGARRFLGRRLGELALALIGRRRRAARRNLELAFPEMTPRARRRLLLAHFRTLGEGALDLTWALTANESEFRARVKVFGAEHLHSAGDGTGGVGGVGGVGGGVLIFMPHFVGMDVGGLRASLEFGGKSAFHYKPPRGKFWGEMFNALRGRFGGFGISTSDSNATRACVKWLREGGALFYFPDVDPGRGRRHVFAPFLGVEKTATTTMVSRLCRAGSARAIPCAARITREGYEVRIFPQWKDFPGPDPEADAARMNEWMSREARENPAGYFWPHRRFRTRPEGEPPRYGEGKEWQSEF